MLWGNSNTDSMALRTLGLSNQVENHAVEAFKFTTRKTI